MTDKTDQLTRTLQRFVNELIAKLPRLDQNEFRHRLNDLDNRVGRLEKALERLSSTQAVKPTRRVKRVTLKDRVIKLVRTKPEGIRTSEVARSLGVAQTNVSHALRQATEEGQITKEKRGLYCPRPESNPGPEPSAPAGTKPVQD